MQRVRVRIRVRVRVTPRRPAVVRGEDEEDVLIKESSCGGCNAAHTTIQSLHETYSKEDEHGRQNQTEHHNYSDIRIHHLFPGSTLFSCSILLLLPLLCTVNSFIYYFFVFVSVSHPTNRNVLFFFGLS